MMASSDRIQLAFMVDLRPDAVDQNSELSYENRLTCVRSCSLKLLTYFANKVPDDNFRWGFKFFNSVTSNVGDKWGFGNFTSKNFDMFESRLEERFEQECMKRESLRRSAAKLMTAEYDNTPCVMKQGLADDDDRSSQLKTGLKEVCHDFTWEQSDLNSPVKQPQARERRRTATLQSKCQNILVIFSPCPRSMDDLTKFAECDGSNLKAVLYSFMPEYLVKELHVRRKVKLHWVHVASGPVESALKQGHCNIDGLKTMDNTLNLVGGCVIPAGAFVQMGSTFTSLLSPVMHHLQAALPALEAEPEDQHCTSVLPLPLSSVMDFYTRPDRQESLSPFDAFLELSNSESGKKLIERIDIRHLHLHSSALSSHEDEKENTTEQTLQLALLRDDNERTSCEISAGHRTHGKVAMKLKGQGCIKAGELPLSALQNDKVYIVTAKPGVQGQSYLEPLISFLAQHQQALVVECMDSVNQMPTTGVLQPLTGGSATLTLIKSPFLGSLERLMAFGKPVTQQQNHPSHIKQFMSQCAASIIGPVVQGQQDPVMSGESYESDKNVVDRNAAAAFNPGMLESWYCSSTVLNNNLIDMLNERSDTGQKKEHRELLKSLCKFYKDQKTRPLMTSENNPAELSAKVLRRSPRKSPRKLPRTSSSKSPLKSPKKAAKKSPRKNILTKKKSDKVVVMDKHRSFTAPIGSRCTVIFQRSKSSTLKKTPRKADKSQAMQDKAGKKHQLASVSVTDFKDTADLVQHLLGLYNKTIEQRNNALHCAQTMVNIAHCYMQSHHENPSEEVDKVFSDYILQTNNQLRDKYSDPQLTNCDEQKADEFELQILLQMELESLISTENDELLESKVQQTVTKLRTLAFIKDTNHLNEFLSRTLLDNYVDTLPKVLVMIYEELLQPLPPQLEAYGDDEDDISSVQPPSNASSTNTDPRSCMSHEDLASVRSNRSKRAVAKFSSFNLGTQRQIAVPGKAKSKGKKIMTRSAKKKAILKQKDKSKAEMRKVRRNLFDRGGNASPAKTPCTPKRLSQRLADKEGATTPKAHHILKTRTVEETPAHKQVKQALWRRQEIYRKGAHTDSDVMVIQESPDKSVALNKTDGPVRTPGRLIGGTKRKSFYSDAPDKQSRNMIRFKESRSIEASRVEQSRYKLLEARMSGRSPTKTQVNPVSKAATSPRRIKPMCLFSHLLSPSPNKLMSPRSTPGSARRRLDVSAFDSPSKNTRSHTQPLNTRSHTQPIVPSQLFATAIQSPLKALQLTPLKCAKFENLFAGRSFSQGTPVDHRPNAIKTPRRIRATSIQDSPLKTPSRTPCRSLLQTPQKSGTPLVTNTPVKCDKETPSFNDLLMSPNRITRLQAQTIFSPHKGLETANSLPRSCLKSPARKTPRRLITLDADTDTTSNPAFSQGTLDVGTETTSNPAFAFSQGNADNSAFSRVVAYESSTSNMGSGEELFSPRRSNRFAGFSDAGLTTPVKSLLPRAVPQTPTSSNEAFTAIKSNITPKHSQAKVKTPESLDKWPRKKQRFIINSPSKTFTPITASVSPTSSSSESDEAVLKENQTLQMSSSNGRERNVNPQGNMNASPAKITSRTSMTPMKRKRNSLENTEDSQGFSTEHYESVATPTKRLRSLQQPSSISSVNSQAEYFNSTEVFLNDRDSARRTNEPVPRVINSRLARILSGGSDCASNTASEPPSSPVFQMAPHILGRQTSHISEHLSWSDQDSQGSVSPVFQRKIDGIISSLNSDTETSPMKPSVPSSPVIGSPNKAFKKYSPNVSAKSLSHLMTSPLVTNKKASPKTAPLLASSQKSSLLNRQTSPPPRPSRRSLYKTKTLSNL